MSDLSSAVIAVFGALSVGYATQFLAEDFRRHRDGSALAAGLAGELSSYRDAVPLLQTALRIWIGMANTEQRDKIQLRPFERPADLIYEQSVSKLGLLGASLVEEIVYVYSNLRAFRLGLELITLKYSEMSNAELEGRFKASLECLDRAADRSALLLPELRARANASFRPSWLRKKPI